MLATLQWKNDRWNTVRYRWNHALGHPSFSMLGERLPAEEGSEGLGITTLQAARLKSQENRSKKKMKNIARQGQLPVGTKFEYTHGMEPFDTRSHELSKRGLGRGILFHFSTQGGKNPYINPAAVGQVRLSTSGWMGPISMLLGNCPRISCSRGIPVRCPLSPAVVGACLHLRAHARTYTSAHRHQRWLGCVFYTMAKSSESGLQICRVRGSASNSQFSSCPRITPSATAG